MTRLEELEQQVNNYMYPQQQQSPHAPEPSQPTQQQQLLQHAEELKIEMCKILQYLRSEDFKTLACNLVVDKLEYILTPNMPLSAEDRMYFSKQLAQLKSPQQAQKTNTRSAEDMVNSKSVENVEKA